MVEDFYIPLSIINNISTYNISKYIEKLNSIINHLDITDIEHYI